LKLVKVKELKKGDLFLDKEKLGCYEINSELDQKIVGDWCKRSKCYFHSRRHPGPGNEGWWRLEAEVWKIETQ